MPYADPLTEDEVNRALASLNGWTREADEIRRTVVCADFRAAIGLVDAEAAQEHRIDDRIHGCRDRDADRERENREGCEERRRAEPPEREPDVAAHGCRG